MTRPANHPPGTLKRQVGVLGATMMGLGSILGTGIFVSVAVAAGAAGPAVLVAIVLAALVAACNGLSSAQLAACHPLSGGTYEYGYRWLDPTLGFTAGWTFLCAKSASAATAALGLAGYTLQALGQSRSDWLVPIAAGSVTLLTLLVLTGVRRSNRVNVVIVTITLVSLITFVMAGAPIVFRNGTSSFRPFWAPVTGQGPLSGLLEACALTFVAYTGYGRIATLGEEIHDPQRNIPRAIVSTLLISALLYLAVGVVAISIAGIDEFFAAASRHAAPLEFAARRFHSSWVSLLVSIGAITAMLGVLLNLVLGLSRVALAMGRRGDLPSGLARLDQRTSTPYIAVLCTGIVIVGLTMIGDIKLTWSFSAFTVLVYYAITNLAAIRMSEEERLYPAWIAWIGLAACLFLAFWVETKVWLLGIGVIAIGLAWQQFVRWRVPPDIGS